MSIAVEANPPKPKKNKYVSWNAAINEFEEHSIKVGTEQIGNYLSIDAAPPVRRAGFLSHNKQVYAISIHDLLRNHFNVTKPYLYPDNPNHGQNPGSTDSMGTQPANNTVQSRLETGPRDELDQESSLRWSEQMLALLNSDDSEA